MSFGLPLFKMKIFLFCYQQACKQKNATLLDIMSASDNMKVQDLILESKRSSLCWYYGFWFDLVSLGGYLWYNSSGANVSYRNFGDFDTEEIYVQYSVGVLYLNPQNTMKWKIVLNSSHTSICSICQKGEISIKKIPDVPVAADVFLLSPLLFHGSSFVRHLSHLAIRTPASTDTSSF